MDHQKKTAQQNASEKATTRSHIEERAEVPLRENQVSQERFPGETPLTGEDRPDNRSDSKQQLHDPAAVASKQSKGAPESPGAPGSATQPQALKNGQRL